MAQLQIYNRTRLSSIGQIHWFVNTCRFLNNCNACRNETKSVAKSLSNWIEITFHMHRHAFLHHQHNERTR
ncbi:hypothetical protein RDWZM_008524, partial [Blomia tropicalis]